MRVNYNLPRFFIPVLFLLYLVLPASGALTDTQLQEKFSVNSSMQFIKNEGQLTDLEGAPVSYVIFKAQQPGIDIYITEKGISYVFLKSEKEDDERKEDIGVKKTAMEYARADMELRGAKILRSNIEYENAATGVYHYYLPHCPNGIRDVKAYTGFTIHNIYPGIDWHWYAVGNKFEYDFVVQPQADASQIIMQYKWADVRSMASGTKLRIHTPKGTLIEGSVKSFSGEEEIQTTYTVSRDKKVQFKVSDYNHEKPLRIDPPLQLVWGTYIGGNSLDGVIGVDHDSNNNTYIAAYVTSSGLPTVNQGGSAYFLGNVTSSGCFYIVKFSHSLAITWATYFGSYHDNCRAMDVDNAGNVYVAGESFTSAIMQVNSGGGAYQQGWGGGNCDACVAKFSSTGSLVWSTSYGGTGDDGFRSIHANSNGDIFVGGYSTSTNFPTLSAGGASFYQGTMAGVEDAVLLKFNSSGARQWATYFGGTGSDFGVGLFTDAQNNIYGIGTTASSSGFPLVNPGGGAYYQGTSGGANDAFLIKFDSALNLNWSTYYGGSNNELGGSVTVDNNGNLFAMGHSFSNNLPTTNPGGGAYYQPNLGGQSDLFVLKTSPAGIMNWATYYGGTGADYVYTGSYHLQYMGAISTDASGNVFLTATSGSGIPVYNPGGGAYYVASALGNDDGVILGFNNNGVRLWGTYFGTAYIDDAQGLHVANDGSIYAVGEWRSSGSNALANPGGGAFYSPAYSSSDDSYILKFGAVNSPLVANISSVNESCSGYCDGVAWAIASGGTAPYTYSWSGSSPEDTISNLCPALYSVTVTDAASATASASANILQGAQLFHLGNDTTVCAGSSVLFNATTSGSSYLWQNGSTASTFTANNAGTYWVQLTTGSCVQRDSILVTQNPLPVVAIGNDTVICPGNTVILDAGNSGSSFLWSNSAATQTISVNSSGLFSVTVTNANQCKSPDSISISVGAGPGCCSISSSFAVTTPTCGQNNGSINATLTSMSSAVSVLWSLNGNAIDSSMHLANAGNGTYIFHAVDSGGCVFDTSFVLSSIGLNNILITSNRDTICAGDSVQVCAPSGFATYLWNTGANSFCINTHTAGNYYVTVADINNCTATSNHLPVIVYPLNPVSLSVNGDTLKAFNAVNYQWYLNGAAIQGANSAMYITTQGGSYQVYVTDTNGCVAVSNPVIISGIENTNGKIEGVKIFPNPLKEGKWNLLVSEDWLDAAIKIFDATGRIVFKSQIINLKSEISLDAASGIYLMEISLKQKQANLKLVKL